MFAQAARYKLDQHPNLLRWIGRMQQWPAYQRQVQPALGRFTQYLDSLKPVASD